MRILFSARVNKQSEVAKAEGQTNQLDPAVPRRKGREGGREGGGERLKGEGAKRRMLFWVAQTYSKKEWRRSGEGEATRSWA